MADKRIGFTGVDTGVSSMMEKLRQSSKQLGNEMISDARKYSQQSKEQLSYLEDQIKALERRNRLEKESSSMQARQQYSGKELAGQLQKIGASSSQDDLQTKLIRELIDTIKLTAKEQISEDRKGVEKQLRLFERDPSQFSPEEQLRLSHQRDLMNPESKKEGSIASQVFMGTFLANALSSVISRVSSLPSVRDEEQAVGSLIGSIPILGAGYNRAREEQLNYSIARSRFRGQTGRNISTLGGYSQFGYSGTEAIDMISGLSQSAGTSNIDGVGAIASMRAFSLDQSQVQDRLRVGRFSQGGQGDFLKEMTRILKASGLEEDRVLFGEILKNQTQLVEQFSQSAEVVNQGMATGAMMMFNKVGGGFSLNDPRSSQRISQIQQSLASPSNDLMKAENIGILRRLNPSAGVFDIMKMQEQGLQTGGFIQGVLGNISNRYQGNDQYGMLALKERLGLSYSATEQLYQNRQSIMSGQMTDSQIEEMSRGGVIAEARKNTADLDVSAAKITDAFVKGAMEGMLEVADQVGGRIAEKIKSAMGLIGIKEDTSSNVTKDPYNGTTQPRRSSGRMF
jgi:hypothetical protein